MTLFSRPGMSDDLRFCLEALSVVTLCAPCRETVDHLRRRLTADGDGAIVTLNDSEAQTVRGGLDRLPAAPTVVRLRASLLDSTVADRTACQCPLSVIPCSKGAAIPMQPLTKSLHHAPLCFALGVIATLLVVLITLDLSAGSGADYIVLQNAHISQSNALILLAGSLFNVFLLFRNRPAPAPRPVVVHRRPRLRKGT